MSELRNGYEWIRKWVDDGMIPQSNIAFTEGDCRLAAELIEYAINTKLSLDTSKDKVIDEDAKI